MIFIIVSSHDGSVIHGLLFVLHHRLFIFTDAVEFAEGVEWRSGSKGENAGLNFLLGMVGGKEGKGSIVQFEGEGVRSG